MAFVDSRAGMKKFTAGVPYGLANGNAGFGVSASASMAKGNSASEGISHTNSHMASWKSATFVSDFRHLRLRSSQN